MALQEVPAQLLDGGTELLTSGGQVLEWMRFEKVVG